MPTKDEIIELQTGLHQAHPTAAGILGAVVVEHDIETLLRYRLAKNDDDLWGDLTADNGPLGTFFRKIQIAHALKIIDAPTQHNLHIVRNIRNAFAHSKKLIDFDNELIVAELKDIEVPRYKRRGHRACKSFKYGAKESYLGLCHYISMHLVRKNIKNMKTYTQRKQGKFRSPFANLLFQNYLTHQQGSLESNPRLPQADQNGGPITAAPGGLLGGLIQLVPKVADDEGK